MEARGGGELAQEEIEVGGVRRSYWLARAPRRDGQGPPPLLVALHGAGMDGWAMAWSTGLARRGPAAGITTVFPDGWKGGWHPARAPADQPDLDDARFLAELTLRLEGAGAARSWPVFLTGIAQGARYAEHVARNALLPVAGLFLVAGTTLELTRRLTPVPQLHASMILVLGTGDKTTPYAGGPLTRSGLSGLVRRRRAVRHGERPGEDAVAGAEDVAADWAAVNGLAGPTTGPAIAELPGPAGGLNVTRKVWARPGCHPVTLYRTDGGGHGWPGGSQLWSARMLGPGAGPLDATGLLLAMAGQETAAAYGRPALDPGQYQLAQGAGRTSPALPAGRPGAAAGPAWPAKLPRLRSAPGPSSPGR